LVDASNTKWRLVLDDANGFEVIESYEFFATADSYPPFSAITVL
jgi:hypothetical protein